MATPGAGAETGDSKPLKQTGEAEAASSPIDFDPKAAYIQLAQARERTSPWATTDTKAYTERLQPQVFDHKREQSLADEQAAKLSSGIMDAFKKADYKSTFSQILSSYQETEAKHRYYPQALNNTLGRQLQGEGLVIKHNDQAHTVTLARPGNQYALRLSTESGKIDMIDQFNGNKIVDSGSKEKLFAGMVKPETNRPGYMGDLVKSLSLTYGGVQELSAIMQTAYQHGYDLNGKQLIGNEAVVKLVEATNQKISSEGRNFQIAPMGLLYKDTNERLWDLDYTKRDGSGTATFYIKEDPSIEQKTGDSRPAVKLGYNLMDFNKALETPGGPERFDAVTRELAKSLESAYKESPGSAAEKLQALLKKGREINDKWRVGYGIGASGISEAGSGNGKADIKIQLLQLGADGKQVPIGQPMKLNLDGTKGAETSEKGKAVEASVDKYKLPKESPKELADELNNLWRQGKGKDSSSDDYKEVFEKVSGRILHAYQNTAGDNFTKMEAAKAAANEIDKLMDETFGVIALEKDGKIEIAIAQGNSERSAKFPNVHPDTNTFYREIYKGSFASSAEAAIKQKQDGKDSKAGFGIPLEKSEFRKTLEILKSSGAKYPEATKGIYSSVVAAAALRAGENQGLKLLGNFDPGNSEKGKKQERQSWQETTIKSQETLDQLPKAAKLNASAKIEGSKITLIGSVTTEAKWLQDDNSRAHFMKVKDEKGQTLERDFPSVHKLGHVFEDVIPGGPPVMEISRDKDNGLRVFLIPYPEKEMPGFVEEQYAQTVVNQVWKEQGKRTHVEFPMWEEDPGTKSVSGLVGMTWKGGGFIEKYELDKIGGADEKSLFSYQKQKIVISRGLGVMTPQAPFEPAVQMNQKFIVAYVAPNGQMYDGSIISVKEMKRPDMERLKAKAKEKENEG